MKAVKHYFGSMKSISSISLKIWCIEDSPRDDNLDTFLVYESIVTEWVLKNPLEAYFIDKNRSFIL